MGSTLSGGVLFTTDPAQARSFAAKTAVLLVGESLDECEGTCEKRDWSWRVSDPPTAPLSQAENRAARRG